MVPATGGVNILVNGGVEGKGKLGIVGIKGGNGGNDSEGTPGRADGTGGG